MDGHHLLVNGLSMNAGGAEIVGQELMRRIPEYLPEWRFSVALIRDFDVHRRLVDDGVVERYEVLWTPAILTRRIARRIYERRYLASFAERRGADVVLQLNGMVIPGLRIPTFSHFQDLRPYRPAAWSGLSDRIVAGLKRRENRRAIREAACCGWVSQYLHDTVCENFQLEPRRSEVLFNGIPDEWIEQVREGATPWEDRPLEIVTVSTVNRYKRQELIVRALARLVERPGLEKLLYRIVGKCEPAMKEHLESLASELGVSDRVVVEGLVPFDQIPSCFQRARCFVLMSVAESFGIPAIEAMCQGTPVVTTDCCALPEICGDASELVPLDDLDELVERISRVLLDREHATRLIEAGRRRVECFHWSDTVSRLAEILQSIVVNGDRLSTSRS